MATTLQVAGRILVVDDQPANLRTLAVLLSRAGCEVMTAANGDARPNQLPETGQEPAATLRERIGRTLTIAAAAGGLAFVVLRVMNRKKVSDDQGSV